MQFPREEIYPQLERKGGGIKVCILRSLLKNTFESIKFHFACPVESNVSVLINNKCSVLRHTKKPNNSLMEETGVIMILL